MAFFVLVLVLLLVLEKNRWDLGASSTSRSTSTALLSTRNPDSYPQSYLKNLNPKEPRFPNGLPHKLL